MKNITLKIDDETHLRARIRATEQGTSLSAVIRRLLQGYASRKDRQEEEEEEAKRIARGKKLNELWDLADKRAQHSGGKSVGPIDREEIYDRHDGKFLSQD